MTGLLYKFERLNYFLKIIIIIFLLLFIAFLDFETGNEISFSIFYLIPITLSAWTIGKYPGIIFSFIGAVLWLIADLLVERNFSITGIIFWNCLVRLGFFLLITSMLIYLKKQIEMEEELTQFLVHDLKSPLANILSSLLLLTEEPVYETDKNLKELLDLSILSAEKMKSFITSILDLGRLENKKMPLKVTEININEIIKAAVSQIKILAKEKNIRINTFLNIKSINADEYLLLRILSNILSNAIKFSPENTEVVIKGDSLKKDGIKIQIEDQGPGIEEGMEQKIFKKYSQLEVHDARRTEGSGLGLIFCKTAVEAHGGKIWIENKKNGGAVVIFTLPQIKIF
jgi:signal transduction histidine kinase